MPALLNTNDANALPATCHSQKNRSGEVECFHVSANYFCCYVTTGAESEHPVGASLLEAMQDSLAFPILRVGRIREDLCADKKERKKIKCFSKYRDRMMQHGPKCISLHT